MVALGGGLFLMSEVPLYPLSGQGLIQVLGSYVCPYGRTVLATGHLRDTLPKNTHAPGSVGRRILTLAPER